MSHAEFYIGDTFDVMATLPDASVDLVLSSPPFLALRSYLPADHPDKGKEIGSEPNPAAFMGTLLALTAEWRRLLRPHGSIAIELGDTYSGSGGAGGDYNADGLRDGQNAFTGSAARGDGWPLDKSLCILPELYAACLSYGRNLLTGEPSPAGQWRVRNLVRWVRPNPPVGALGDKYRPATSVMTVACLARDRWFDLDAVRTEPQAQNDVPSNGPKAAERESRGVDGVGRDAARINSHPAGAPPLDWWNIPTHPYKGAHYATWPPALCKTPIDSMCPREVCAECGEPRRRIVDVSYTPHGDPDTQHAEAKASADYDGQQRQENAQGMTHGRATKNTETLGWTDCGHDNYQPGTVLDPFAGTGTTLAVATGLARNAIGIDLDPRNADLAAERVGMFLTVRSSC